jgi:hypothetical protein
LNEFFGVGKAPAKLGTKVSGPRQLAAASTDSIFGRLLDHVLRFGSRCGWFFFVTHGGTESDFENLLAAVRVARSREDLSEELGEAFARLHWALAQAFPSLSIDDFWNFLQRLHIREPGGRLSDLKGIRTVIGERIAELSEVNLHVSEAQKIASELVFAVRERSHRGCGADDGSRAARSEGAGAGRLAEDPQSLVGRLTCCTSHRSRIWRRRARTACSADAAGSAG